ncbi:MAG TPA: DJ-1/PfpI/YhbO family deglycase/protease [Coleofasciculaceae cyanobacterium]|jgi:protease I
MVINNSNQKRVAILIDQQFEDCEFQIPYKALKQVGARVTILGSRLNEKYQGKQGQVSIKPDGTVTEARPQDFDAVVIPGGMAPDTMRNNPNAVEFVQKALQLGKLVAAVCHGPQMLIEGDLLKGKNATGFVSIRKDMINAGANYLDEPLVVDGNLITSRQPGDLAIFTTAILAHLGLSLPDQVLPDLSDNATQWWQLAEAWGGNKKNEIVDALNTALTGERYTRTAFGHYAQKTTDAELRSLLYEMSENKQRHIQILESRLRDFDASESLPASGADAYASLQAWLQSSDDIAILRRTLGDIQTGVVDAYNLRKQYTDPTSTAIFTEIEADLAQYEQRLAKLYHERLNSQAAQPAKPTTGATVSA